MIYSVVVVSLNLYFIKKEGKKHKVVKPFYGVIYQIEKNPIDHNPIEYYQENTEYLSENFNRNIINLLNKKPLVFIDLEFVTIDGNKSVPFKYGVYIIPAGKINNVSDHKLYEGFIKDKFHNLIEIEEDLINDEMKKWLQNNGFNFFNNGKFSTEGKGIETLFKNQIIENKKLSEIKQLIDKKDAVYIGQNIKVDLLGYQKPKALDSRFESPIFTEEELNSKIILDFTDLGGYVKERTKYFKYGPISLKDLWTEIVNETKLQFKGNKITNFAHSSPLVDCAFSADIVMKAVNDNNIFLFQNNDNVKNQEHKKKLNCETKDGNTRCKLRSEVVECNSSKNNKYKYKLFNCGNAKIEEGEISNFKTCVETNKPNENIKYCDIPKDVSKHQ